LTQQVLLWGLFAVLIVVCLAIDLRLGSKRTGRMSVRTAAIWSVVWIALSMAFAFVIGVYQGTKPALLYVTGYWVEKALSVDNMFVFIMVFAYFSTADEDQPRVLKWGILGAVFFRGVLIAIGAWLIQRFDWILYVFAALLLWAAWKMVTHGDEKIEPEKNPVLRFARRLFPIVDRYEGHHFITREGGKWHGTALLIVLIVVESTDVMFALDSIPAIYAITTPARLQGVITASQEVFIVFTSNIFAILGLRALFFVLAGIMDMFRFLKMGVAAILGFVAVKMIAHKFVHIPIWASLGTIAAILVASIVASIAIKSKPAPPSPGL